jgi:murein DD-endopeptidase MepM/ murein hydrolase activator NlpD
MTDPILPPLAPIAADPATAKPPVDRARVAELAHQFESMLMTQMLRSMRQSMLSDQEETDGFGKSTMTDAFDSELGQALSQAGGIGLTSILVRAFERQAAAAAPSVAAAPTPTALEAPAVAPPLAAPVPFPVAAPPVAAPVPLPVAAPPVVAPPVVVPPTATGGAPAPDAGPVLPAGRVTSAFGWRNDPFNGKVHFHAGTDVKMAYGQEVRSAAAGRVSFVGEQSGYGLTVVVDHGGGVESRYAHLSSADVRAGDAVASGQPIARSGNSGRSTGPHLHFEVLDNGRAVAPETMGDLLH